MFNAVSEIKAIFLQDELVNSRFTLKNRNNFD